MFPHLALSPDPPPANNHLSLQSQEEFESLFDSGPEEQVPSPEEEGPPALSDNDLAVFDPCYKQGTDKYQKTTITGKLTHFCINSPDRTNQFYQ